MDIRTFESFTMKDAIKSIKKELGADAVILSTKEKTAPGGKGVVYEVTAAAADTGRKVGAMAGAPASTANRHIETQVEGISIRLTAMQDSVANKRQVQGLETGMQELKLLLLESLKGKDGSPLKDLPVHLISLDRQLRIMGVEDTAIADLMKHLRALPEPQKGDPQADAGMDEYTRDQAIRWMMKRIKIAPKWTLASGTTSVQAIVGPAGSGKSSTVAKLAAHYHLREKAKVQVISLDNQRLAAADQMRIFCKIIDVPFTAVASATELAGVLATKQDREIVLIDTAGVSAKSASGIEQLQVLRHANTPIDFHLCLAITEKEAQLDQAVRVFSAAGIASLIFTKLDESWSYGEIYNVSKKWGLPLSFFSLGQGIPEDFERATRERVIERIFGL
jgi:flagellar biosynthesis protein FlhF